MSPDRRRQLVAGVRSPWQVSIALCYGRSDLAAIIAVPTCCCGAKHGRSTASRFTGFAKEMGLNYAEKRQVKAKLSGSRCAAPCFNDVWAMGPVQDQLATGPKLRS